MNRDHVVTHVRNLDHALIQDREVIREVDRAQDIEIVLKDQDRIDRIAEDRKADHVTDHIHVNQGLIVDQNQTIGRIIKVKKELVRLVVSR